MTSTYVVHMYQVHTLSRKRDQYSFIIWSLANAEACDSNGSGSPRTFPLSATRLSVILYRLVIHLNK